MAAIESARWLEPGNNEVSVKSMSTRSSKPPTAAKFKDSAKVTVMPDATARQKKSGMSGKLDSETSLRAYLTPDEIANLKQRIAQLPDIDAARIVELHDRIKTGDYEVDPGVVADKIQQFESDL